MVPQSLEPAKQPPASPNLFLGNVRNTKSIENVSLFNWILQYLLDSIKERQKLTKKDNHYQENTFRFPMRNEETDAELKHSMQNEETW